MFSVVDIHLATRLFSGCRFQFLLKEYDKERSCVCSEHTACIEVCSRSEICAKLMVGTDGTDAL